MRPPSPTRALPPDLKPLFWDCEFRKLSWAKHRDFIIGRILAVGMMDALRWLRGRVSDRELRAWIIRRKGRGLDNRQLRYWQVMLRLPKRRVDRWLKDEFRQIWENRCAQ